MIHSGLHTTQDVGFLTTFGTAIFDDGRICTKETFGEKGKRKIAHEGQRKGLGIRCSLVYLRSFCRFYTKFIQTLQDDSVGGNLLLNTTDKLIM
jgi:hypothetical protein